MQTLDNAADFQGDRGRTRLGEGLVVLHALRKRTARHILAQKTRLISVGEAVNRVRERAVMQSQEGLIFPPEAIQLRKRRQLEHKAHAAMPIAQ